MKSFRVFKRTLSLTSLGLSLLFLFPGSALPAIDARFGSVDYRFLLAAHPMMGKFDVTTRRFAETVSTPLSDPIHAKLELTQKSKTLLAKMNKLDEAIKKILQTRDPKAKEAYDLYWKKRRTMNEEYESVKSALESVGVQGNYHQGIPSQGNVLSVTMQINRTIRDVLTVLQKKYRLIAILDISEFRQNPPDISSEPLIPQFSSNPIWNLWQGRASSPEDWQGFKKFWKGYLQTSQQSRIQYPFHAGVVDLTQEAVTLIQKYSQAGF